MTSQEWTIPGAYLLNIEEHDGDPALKLLEIAQQYLNGASAGRIVAMRLVLDIEKGDEERLTFVNLNHGPACSEIDQCVTADQAAIVAALSDDSPECPACGCATPFHRTFCEDQP